MTFFTITIPRITESQNVRDRLHHMVRDREKRDWKQSLMVRRTFAMHAVPGVFLYATIISYRPRLITDVANLIGGAKGLVDALVQCEYLTDDNDKCTRIYYQQFTLKHSPIEGMRSVRGRAKVGRVPCTVIAISDQKPEP